MTTERNNASLVSGGESYNVTFAIVMSSDKNFTNMKQDGYFGFAPSQ